MGGPFAVKNDTRTRDIEDNDMYSDEFNIIPIYVKVALNYRSNFFFFYILCPFLTPPPL